MLLGILLFFFFVGIDLPSKFRRVLVFFAGDEPVIEKPKQKDKETDRERARYESSSYEKWRKQYESSRHDSEYERYKREEDKSDINNKVDKLFNLIVKDFISFQETFYLSILDQYESLKLLFFAD